MRFAIGLLWLALAAPVASAAELERLQMQGTPASVEVPSGFFGNASGHQPGIVILPRKLAAEARELPFPQIHVRREWWDNRARSLAEYEQRITGHPLYTLVAGPRSHVIDGSPAIEIAWRGPTVRPLTRDLATAPQMMFRVFVIEHAERLYICELWSEVEGFEAASAALEAVCRSMRFEPPAEP